MILPPGCAGRCSRAWSALSTPRSLDVTSTWCRERRSSMATRSQRDNPRYASTRTAALRAQRLPHRRFARRAGRRRDAWLVSPRPTADSDGRHAAGPQDPAQQSPLKNYVAQPVGERVKRTDVRRSGIQSRRTPPVPCSCRGSSTTTSHRAQSVHTPRHDDRRLDTGVTGGSWTSHGSPGHRRDNKTCPVTTTVRNHRPRRWSADIGHGNAQSAENRSRRV